MYQSKTFAKQLVLVISWTQPYTEILRGDFVKTLGDYELDMSESTFQQDNVPKRTSHIARKWLETNSVKVLEWSVQSVVY